ncbi:hypothetical protein [Streptomyces sp. NPDC054842]
MPMPHGVAAWNATDTRRWLAARPGVWSHPLPTALALGAAFAVATDAPSGELHTYLCGGHASCDPRWWVTAHLGLAVVVVLHWLRRLPLLAASALPLIVLGTAVQPRIPAATCAAVAVAAGYAALGCLHRLHVARRQRHLALHAAGSARLPLPEDVDTSGRSGPDIGCGVPLLAFALLALTLSAFHSTVLWKPSDWQYLGLFTLVMGLNTGATGLAARRRIAVLRRSPAPALRVLLRPGGGADDRRTDIFAADDAEGSSPVFSCWTSLPSDGVLREAVLYGVPCTGAELILRTEEKGGFTTEPVRPQYRAEPPADSWETGAGVVRWRAGIVARSIVLAYLALLPLLVAGTQGPTPNLPGAYVLASVVAVSVPLVVTVLNWQVLADRDGLRITTMVTTHRVPWDKFRSVTADDSGFQVRYAVDRTAEVYPALPPRWIAALLSRRPRARAAVDAIRVLAADPALRPTEAARAARPHERVVGPAVAVYCLAICIASVLVA